MTNTYDDEYDNSSGWPYPQMHIPSLSLSSGVKEKDHRKSYFEYSLYRMKEHESISVAYDGDRLLGAALSSSPILKVDDYISMYKNRKTTKQRKHEHSQSVTEFDSSAQALQPNLPRPPSVSQLLSKRNRDGRYPSYFEQNDGAYEGDVDLNGKKKEGFGVFLADSGEVYIGEWADDQMHGEGILHLPFGGSIYGQFRANKVQGIAILQLPSNHVYVAQWKDSRIHGKCFELSTQNRMWTSSIFNQGQMKERIATETAEISATGIVSPHMMDAHVDLRWWMNRLARKQYFNERMEESNWTQKHFRHINVEKGLDYIGFVEGTTLIPFGLGLVSFEKRIIQGCFKKGVLEGSGRMVMENGDIYDGNFKAGQLNGCGVYYNFKQNSYVHGLFEANKVVSVYEKGSSYPGRILEKLKRDAHSRHQRFMKRDSGISRLAALADFANQMFQGYVDTYTVKKASDAKQYFNVLNESEMGNISSLAAPKDEELDQEAGEDRSGSDSDTVQKLISQNPTASAATLGHNQSNFGSSTSPALYSSPGFKPINPLKAASAAGIIPLVEIKQDEGNQPPEGLYSVKQNGDSSRNSKNSNRSQKNPQKLHQQGSFDPQQWDQIATSQENPNTSNNNENQNKKEQSPTSDANVFQHKQLSMQRTNSKQLQYQQQAQQLQLQESLGSSLLLKNNDTSQQPDQSMNISTMLLKRHTSSIDKANESITMINSSYNNSGVIRNEQPPSKTATDKREPSNNFSGLFPLSVQELFKQSSKPQSNQSQTNQKGDSPPPSAKEQSNASSIARMESPILKSNDSQQQPRSRSIFANSNNATKSEGVENQTQPTNTLHISSNGNSGSLVQEYALSNLNGISIIPTRQRLEQQQSLQTNSSFVRRSIFQPMNSTASNKKPFRQYANPKNESNIQEIKQPSRELQQSQLNIEQQRQPSYTMSPAIPAITPFSLDFSQSNNHLLSQQKQLSTYNQDKESFTKMAAMHTQSLRSASSSYDNRHFAQRPFSQLF